ncbi:hypothetical protein BST61_g7510 [Cercospora zeina]
MANYKLFPPRDDTEGQQRTGHLSALRPSELVRMDCPVAAAAANGVKHEVLVPTNSRSVAEMSRYDPSPDKNKVVNADVHDVDDVHSWDLIVPNGWPIADEDRGENWLEERAEKLYSADHLRLILSEPTYYAKFLEFMRKYRPARVPILMRYLATQKAIRALEYANSLTLQLSSRAPVPASSGPCPTPVENETLQHAAREAFAELLRDDLHFFIAHRYIKIVSGLVTRRITGTSADHLSEENGQLGEVFCLTDCRLRDHPIILASEGFTRHSGGSLHNGELRYFLGAQVDVSPLLRECAGLESLRALMERQTENNGSSNNGDGEKSDARTKMEALSEMLSGEELEIIREHGGTLQANRVFDTRGAKAGMGGNRVLIADGSDSSEDDGSSSSVHGTAASIAGIASMDGANGNLAGVYRYYILVRPAPSLRILFASPTMRSAAPLQTPLLHTIGGSRQKRENLEGSLRAGDVVTARVRWLNTPNENGEGPGGTRWLHCTPLIHCNGQVGLWMIILVKPDGDGGSMHADQNVLTRSASAGTRDKIRAEGLASSDHLTGSA